MTTHALMELADRLDADSIAATANHMPSLASNLREAATQLRTAAAEGVEYHRAKKSTRELVFTNGEKGVEDGGTTNHLAEAGITIVHDTAIAGAAGVG